MTYKVLVIRNIEDNKFADLESLLNDGWIIDRCDCRAISTGANYSAVKGDLIYILKMPTLKH